LARSAQGSGTVKVPSPLGFAGALEKSRGPPVVTNATCRNRRGEVLASRGELQENDFLLLPNSENLIHWFRSRMKRTCPQLLASELGRVLFCLET